MKEILEKISNYNLFNYLLPGVLYFVIIEEVTNYKLVSSNIIFTAFVCYFVGLVISRIGSLFIETLLRKTGFLKFKEYKDFVVASKKDIQLEILSEQNNMYRTFIAMFLTILVTKCYEWLGDKIIFFNRWKVWIVLFFLFFLFLWAYRKQTKYINKRIENNL